MPDVPDGLTSASRARTGLPHQRARPARAGHARRIRAYNGTTVRAFSAKDCGKGAATAAAQTTAQEMHDNEAVKRSADADASSLAIDPFDKKINLDC